MAFASGQTVTAAMLNRITRNDLSVVCSGNQTVGLEAVIPGLTMSVTTTQPNTKLTVSADLDIDIGSGDFIRVRLYIDGAGQPSDINRAVSGRFPAGREWVVTITSAGTYTVDLRSVKLSGAGTTTIFSGHSTLNVHGNGIS